MKLFPVSLAILLVFAPGGCRSGARVDVAAVRGALADDSRGAFDLIVALQGLDSAGAPDWARAQSICGALKWPRCDRLIPALVSTMAC